MLVSLQHLQFGRCSKKQRFRHHGNQWSYNQENNLKNSEVDVVRIWVVLVQGYGSGCREVDGQNRT